MISRRLSHRGRSEAMDDDDWSHLPVSVVEGKSGRDIQRSIDSLARGGTVFLDGEEYVVEETIRVPSRIRIQGRGSGSTKIRLADGAACHVFTNADHRKGNENLRFAGLSIDGNMERQTKPAGLTALTFCCGVYLKTVRFVSVRGITAHRIRQTGLHFNNCNVVRVSNYSSQTLGWSGVSTSGTDDISIEGDVRDAGLDVLHSGIHLDGGQGAYFNGRIDGVTGNGVMLDSKFRAFGLCKIEATITRAKRGVSLSGDHTNMLSNVFVTGVFADNRETGIMVSNSAHVTISNCRIANNPDYGILFQGRKGGRECLVINNRFSGNGTDIAELHESGNNYFFGNEFSDDAKLPLSETRPEVVGTGRSSGTVAGENTPIGHSCRSTAERRRFETTSYEAVCAVCGKPGVFVREQYAIRETFRCPNCAASLRHRCQAEAILAWHDDPTCRSIADLVERDSFRALHVYEPGIVGPFRRFFQRLPTYHVSYFWEDCPKGQERHGVRNENLMDLTYPDDSFDLIVTSDIMEHIRRPYTAFREIRRVMKPNGVHVFSIPVLDPMPKTTVFRVDTSGDQDIHILPPHYHISGTNEKSLVYTDFGEDMIVRLEHEVGVQVDVHRTCDGFLPELKRILTFVMRHRDASSAR